MGVKLPDKPVSPTKQNQENLENLENLDNLDNLEVDTSGYGVRTKLLPYTNFYLEVYAP